jgi:hypothetical protein
MNKCVLTIATGKKVYVDMACNLAMSFVLWNKDTGIKFILITDGLQYIPQELQGKITIAEVAPGELGLGFSAKLQMDRFGQPGQNLFIDADCLVYGNLEPVFDYFSGSEVAVIGHKLTEGKNVGYCEDVTMVMHNAGITYFPLLCGSVYYFEKGELSTKVFDHARSLLRSYREIGLVLLNGKENEEPLIAIGMAKFDLPPLKDTGMVKADRMFYQYLQTNVINGSARLWNENNIPVPEYSQLMDSTPLIVHFNSSHAESYEYHSEVIRLKKFFLEKKNKFIANASAYFSAVLPGKATKIVKNIFRPVYHVLFGKRDVKLSRRA